MKIKPLNDRILFKFFDEIKNGFFTEKHNSGIVVDLGKNHKHSSEYSRMGKVVAVGPKVTDIGVGDIIVVEALKWTKQIKIAPTQVVWMTEQRFVSGVME